MQTTETFKVIIWNYLLGRAEEDEVIFRNLYEENKSIDACVAYILSEVKKSGKSGFADEEIFSMALHYYDEDNHERIEEVGAVRIVVNEPVQEPPKVRTTKSKKSRVEVVDNLLFGDNESED